MWLPRGCTSPLQLHLPICLLAWLQLCLLRMACSVILSIRGPILVLAGIAYMSYTDLLNLQDLHAEL